MDAEISIVSGIHWIIHLYCEYMSLSGSVDLVQRDKLAVSFFFFDQCLI